MAKAKVTVGELLDQKQKLDSALGQMKEDTFERNQVRHVRDWFRDLIKRIEISF